ncbi:MAG: CHAT domain-containing tetratricopeptide repeat protein [Candidatus Hatepunaea meridiana]|nr:CHAT domain-containing tetratricopeptide repeat protein [Candidatus Hatepunaea meridiana]
MKSIPIAPIFFITLFTFQPLIAQASNSLILKTKADSLVRAADSLIANSQPQKALEDFEEALSIFIGLGDMLNESEVLKCMANINLSRLYYKKALDYHLRRLEIVQELEDRYSESRILGYIGLVYKKLNDSEKALDYARQSLSISRELGDRETEAITLNGIAKAYMHRSNFIEAINYYKQSLTLQKEIEDKKGEAHTAYWIGNAYMYLADYQEAQKYCRHSLTIQKEINDRAGEEKTCFCIGNIYTYLSDYTKALEYYQRGLEISRETGNKYSEAKTLGNIGLIYGRLSDYLKALEYYQQSLIMRRKIKDRQGEGSALGNIGIVYKETDNYPRALEYCMKSLAIQREIGDKKSEFSTLCGIGNIYEQYSDYTKALECYKESLKITKEVNDKRRESWALYCIGELYYSQENYGTAVDYIQKALRIARDLDTYGDLEKYYTILLGECNIAQGLDSKAVVNFKEAIEMVENVRGKLEVESHKRSYTARVSKLYGDMVLALLRINEKEEAYSYIERGRARSFLDMLASGDVEVGKSKHSEFLHNDECVQVEDIKEEKQYEPELASLITVNPLSLSEVQELLDENSTILEYFITEKKLLVWQITRNNAQIYEMEVLSKDIKEIIEAFRETIALIGSTGNLSRELYKMLIEPAANHINTEKLIIIPHGILHYLPFQALQDQNGEFLLEKYRISYLPSASVLKYIIHKRRGKGSKLFALGNPAITREDYKPLKFAEVEVNMISKLYENSDILTGKSATETNFRELAAKYDILHLACHSELNSAYPLFSGLLLAPDNLQDGELDVHEVFTMDLNAYLVVLSGCETGMGHLTTGDELVGLSRAFIYAGTPSLIASIWRVEDESTGYLMESFYKNLKNLNKAEALREAQIATKEKYSDMFFWAPFVLIGDEN